jgi:ABC-type Fe3+-siderophore transport system permease subunit
MKLDKQKEKIANYRLVWGISLTALLGIIAFIFNSFDKLPLAKQILATLGGIISVIIVLYLSWKLNIETEKLEDL